MSEYRGASVKIARSVLALAIGAGVTACDGGHHDPAAVRGPGSASCIVGYVKQNHIGAAISTFSVGPPIANGYEITFTNRGSSRSVTVSSVSVKFFDSSGAQIRSDTVRLLTLHVAPGKSLTQIFYGPNSGYVMLDNPVPGDFISDRSMPSGARQCQVTKW